MKKMSEYTLKRNGNIINKKYLEYFVPTVLTEMANNIAVMVDSILVGHMVGSTSMAAINLLSPVIQFYFSMTILFGLGASTIISYAKGKNDKATADKTFTVAFIALLFLSAVLMIVQFLLLDPIASIFTSIPELKRELILYYIPVIAGTPFSLLLPSVVHCIRSDGRPNFASNLIILSNAVNLVMDIVLMGPFHMGIIGSSIATVIGNVIAFFMMLTHFKDRRNTLHFDFSIFQSIKEFFGKLGLLFATGVSGALGTLLITVKMFYLNSMVQNEAGKDGMVAMSVISMCQIFVSAFVTGASQTMIPIVSVLLGEKDLTGIQYAFRNAVLILLAASVAIMLVIEGVPEFVAQIFGDKTAQEMSFVVPALRISSLSFPGLALSFLLMYYFMATKKKFLSLTISIVNGIAIIVPCAYVLSEIFGITGIWLTLVVAQYGTLLFIAVMVFVIIKRSNGRYKNFYLIESSKDNELLSFSVNSALSKEEIASYMTEKLADIDYQAREKMILATAEVLAFVKELGAKRGKPVETDIRVNREGNDYIILLRSNGYEIKMAEMHHTICKSFDYTRVLGMNQIKIVV